MKAHLVPGGEARAETQVLRSRFIASAAPAFSVEEAKRYIQRIRCEFPDATHHVPAYVIGHGASVIAHCNDDGEPSGTAGRPALAVLRGSDLGDVVVVVTRYFGGAKLGTGGLVRAYAEAVRCVLENLPRAQRVPIHIVKVAAPYALLVPIRQAVGVHHGKMLNEEFAAEAALTAQFRVNDFPSFRDALQEISNGTIEAEIAETRDATIPVAASSSGLGHARDGQIRGNHGETA